MAESSLSSTTSGYRSLKYEFGASLVFNSIDWVLSNPTNRQLNPIRTIVLNDGLMDTRKEGFNCLMADYCFALAIFRAFSQGRPTIRRTNVPRNSLGFSIVVTLLRAVKFRR